jgi:WD40 repeat protein
MLFGEGQRIRSLSVRHDGALVAGGSTTGTVWLWEISDGSQPEIVDVTQIDVADEEVLAVEFVGNGDRLLFGTADGNIHLWEVDPPAAIGEPLQGLGPVRSLAAHPTSDAAFVVSDGGARLRLVLDEEEWVDVACELADPSPTREEWNLYLGGVRPLRSTCDVLGR